MNRFMLLGLVFGLVAPQVAASDGVPGFVEEHEMCDVRDSYGFTRALSRVSGIICREGDNLVSYEASSGKSIWTLYDFKPAKQRLPDDRCDGDAFAGTYRTTSPQMVNVGHFPNGAPLCFGSALLWGLSEPALKPSSMVALGFNFEFTEKKEEE